MRAAMALLMFLMLGKALSVSAQSKEHLETMVVTGSLRAQRVEDVLASIQVIDRESLDRFGQGSVAQVLKHAVGLQTSDSGQAADVSVRGFNRNQTLVLIDGLRRTNNYGSTNLSQVSLYDIERIEIIRGPMSSLYGSDALGGVINIITRRPSPGLQGQVATTVGTAERGRESVTLGLNVQGGTERVTHGLTVDRDARNAFRHSDSLDDDFAALENLSASYRAHVAVAEQTTLNLTAEVFDRRSDAIMGDGSVRREREQRQFAAAVLQSEVGPGNALLRASYGDSEGYTNRSFPALETTDYTQYQADASYQLALGAQHSVILGGGLIDDRLDVSINSQRAERSNYFAFAQHEWSATEALQLMAGLRYDTFNDFGSSLNPRVSASWDLGPWSLRAGYGQAFRAPGLLELYASFVRGGRTLIVGNTALKAETAETVELAVKYEFQGGDIEVIAHRNTIDNLINSFTTGRVSQGLAIVEYQNIDSARINGVEIIGSLYLSDTLQVNAGVDLLDAIDRADQSRLLGRARQQWRASVQKRWQDLSLGLRGRYMVDYFAVGINAPRGSEPYNSHLALMDLELSYRASERLQLSAGVDNVLDRRDPNNFSVTATGNQRNGPDTRFVYSRLQMTF